MKFNLFNIESFKIVRSNRQIIVKWKTGNSPERETIIGMDAFESWLSKSGKLNCGFFFFDGETKTAHDLTMSVKDYWTDNKVSVFHKQDIKDYLLHNILSIPYVINTKSKLLCS